ncbi:MAG: PP2C family protein-serine/threonine phosphatase [Pyrinomonadaceae bacterium]
MNDKKPTAAKVALEVAAISDRGLSERRPVNEDSFLSDAERRIFAVADGVGGAEAGEVASQTAIEVLDDAFRHHRDGDDVEDLMEIAFQRANSTIFQLSREKERFSMMATTIVALHLDGRRATVGHVGDSRLYRLTPAGQLLRETSDHSMVEEEVRAGRMTPEQAATHPSRNVISRALGAEPTVEADLKTVEVEDGTVFLLCSDGITRHLPDAELGALLYGGRSLEAACEEMKRLCYERGAEDNLTAVTVCVGPRPAAVSPMPAIAGEDLERTLITGRPGAAVAGSSAVANSGATSAAAADILRRPFAEAGMNTPQPSRIEVNTDPAPQQQQPIRPAVSQGTNYAPASAAQSRGGGGGGAVVRALGVLLFVLAAAAVAFYAGTRFPQVGDRLGLLPSLSPTPETAATPATLDAAAAPKFEQVRREIDLAPQVMLAQLAGEQGGQPLTSNDPEFLYLYGRALLLSGRNQEALQAFEMAGQKMRERPATPGRDPLDVENRIATAAATLKSNNPQAVSAAAARLDEVMVRSNGTPGAAAQPQP